MRAILLCLLAVTAAAVQVAADAPDAPKAPAVPLFAGLGVHTRPVATGNATAQRYFDQGLMFMFAFNHDEAVRAFRRAAELDPDCAMAYWGVALASGVNINNPSFPADKARAAAVALNQAGAKAKGETAANRALIAALAARYPDPPPDDQAAAEKAYSAAMKQAAEEFPRDADVGALYAESLMNLRPWDLWTADGKPQPGTPELLGVLETVRALAPDHPLDNHLYIHALEASPDPGKADGAAERLRGKHSALGHLLHMPSHIDIRRGRWQEAVAANQLAIAADRNYQTAVPRQGYYLLYIAHNFAMLTFAATMQGQSRLALETTRAMVAGIPEDWVAVKENAEIADAVAALPLEVLKRFGRWDDVLAEPEPPERFPIARALRHSARGVAQAARGRVDEARAEQKAFRAAAEKVPADARFGNNKAGDLLAIAGHLLEGEILFREGKRKESAAELREAVAREDRLRYDEPPDAFVPARHALGAVLLRDRQAGEAEAVYREDLRRWPDNGWSLHGLAASLEAQGKTDEAARARARFDEVWRRADVKIPSSCYCVAD